MTHALPPLSRCCRIRKALLWLVLTVAAIGSGQAQFYTGSEMSFGRKRVQYEKFFWSYYRFDGFDVYFNRKGKNLALYTANYLQYHLPEMEQAIGYQAQDALKFIVFNRLSDFKQSNIGYLDESSEASYNTGGVTRFIDNKVFLYFEGDYVAFERQIRRGMASVLLTQAISGAKVSTQYKNSYLMDLPLWFTEGLASYFSEPWNEQYDERIQQAILRNDYRYLSDVYGEDAAFAGHAFWYFIAQQYGTDAVPRCVRIVASERNIDKTFRIALNVKLKDLLKGFRAFYAEREAGGGRDSLSHHAVLKRTNKPETVYSRFTVNPGAVWRDSALTASQAALSRTAARRGRQGAGGNASGKGTAAAGAAGRETAADRPRHGGELAFTSNWLGRAKVYIQSLNPSRRRCIYRTGAGVNDMPDYSFPVLAWHPNGHALGIVTEEKGRTTLIVYDLEKKRKGIRRYYLDYFEKITSFCFSPDGRSIAIAASSNGQSDIYLHNLTAGTDKQITFDLYDDRQPTFIPGTSLLVFESNRPDDTLRKGEKFEVAPSMKKGSDLFAYDLKKGGITLFRMTDGGERVRLSDPNPIDGRRLLFLTNAAGKTDVAAGAFGRVMDHVDTAVHYRRTFESTTLGNRPAGLREIDVSAKAGVYTSLGLENGRYVLAVEPLSPLRDGLYPKLPRPVLATPTAFKSAVLAKEARMARRKAVADSLEAAAAADTAVAVTAGAASPGAGRPSGLQLTLRAARGADRRDTTAFDRYLAARAAAGLSVPRPEAEAAPAAGASHDPAEAAAPASVPGRSSDAASPAADTSAAPANGGPAARSGSAPSVDTPVDSTGATAARRFKPKKKNRRKAKPHSDAPASAADSSRSGSNQIGSTSAFPSARTGAGVLNPLATGASNDTAAKGRTASNDASASASAADFDSLTATAPARVPPKQYTYRPEFSINQATAQLGFSFLNATYQAFTNSSSPIYLNSDVNGFTQISLSDLMENHRIVGGFSFSFDFTTFEYLLSYEYLERRLGHQFVFHIINRNDNSMNVEPYKQNTYNGYYVMKYPLSPVSMLKGTVFARYDRTVFKSYEWNSLTEPMQRQLKVGLKGEWVYDHARFVTQNIYYGTRGKVFAEYYQGIVHDNQNLFVVGFDFRDYRRLYKTLIWANRIAGSTSFGQQKLVYYMGGIDGWLLPRFNRDVKTDPNQNYAYQTLATNMRGFIQNIRNGNSFLVINSEIRFPFVQVISRGPVKSSFLRHLQLVAFADVGSAWSDWNPWSKDNPFYKQTIEDGKITIELEKEANPIVLGFGTGLRCQLLGYFMRFDLAWGVENGRVHDKPVFYFSLSTDF